MDKILVVDDAPDFQLMVKSALGNRYEITPASTLSDARSKIRSRHFDLILLDVGMPDGDGFKFCEELRSDPKTVNTPLIFLSGRSELDDKVQGFSSGGDDYVVKPFEARELLARVESKLTRLRQNTPRFEGLFQKGLLSFEVTTLRAYRMEGDKKTDLALTPIEFKILIQLARNEARVVSREQLIATVWGEGTHVFDRATDKHVSSLRQKLGGLSGYIETVSGIGYRFNPNPNLNPSSGSSSRQH